MSNGDDMWTVSEHDDGVTYDDEFDRAQCTCGHPGCGAC
jgi:hypothetical protein